ncbi:phosphonate C-P lyase system protein PhnG [Bacillaceae bacterium ZC4]|uniref:phosphonate C-P lyase system protein PhnG n=1 Tax=Aeribacillus TaxID=1055323 RepID=UPI00118BD77B|nr:phosphonate C-P lyase system protein PhnG [Aeribacillus composti]AXI40436.1 phosphonate C-P lyase system protein PhnG [Bacillaceae bacterium ZC4]MED0715003.1 phosphonate C-P lyase system protein PhnG [Aeribacillus composti]MED0744412.1 phosphonate C-P lyase system protein PhnG [Aeribacillus composti]TVZ78220.1 alpha-D-ribose 1-methylphosphonate 5-triphosphate synthase subunit PhnG [Aeribacillus composti]
MERRRRTEILINGNKNVAATLAQQILAKYEVKTIEKPNNGLVMVKVRETAKNSLFYLGEVFVTECKVEISGYIGFGILKGHEPELAYHLAVVDAAYNAQLPETERWNEVLLKEEAAIHEQRKNSFMKILKTKVNFETMDV